jgi:alkanesulfonate monooxygenase SsuD/methylene tetrahydromethanopterin reductase-like flavin-dependent oxidoreductase (luciferase family)
LLSGERVTYEGKVVRLPAPGVQLNVRPARRQIPIYLGRLGQKGLSVAGAVADGVLFSVLCSPGFVRKGLAHVRAGAKGVARSLEDMDIACYVIFSVDEDVEAARQAAKELVASYLTLVLDPVRITDAGLSVENSGCALVDPRRDAGAKGAAMKRSPGSGSGCWKPSARAGSPRRLPPSRTMSCERLPWRARPASAWRGCVRTPRRGSRVPCFTTYLDPTGRLPSS